MFDSDQSHFVVQGILQQQSESDPEFCIFQFIFDSKHNYIHIYFSDNETWTNVNKYEYLINFDVQDGYLTFEFIENIIVNETVIFDEGKYGGTFDGEYLTIDSAPKNMNVPFKMRFNPIEEEQQEQEQSHNVEETENPQIPTSKELTYSEVVNSTSRAYSYCYIGIVAALYWFFTDENEFTWLVGWIAIVSLVYGGVLFPDDDKHSFDEDLIMADVRSKLFGRLFKSSAVVGIWFVSILYLTTDSMNLPDTPGVFNSVTYSIAETVGLAPSKPDLSVVAPGSNARMTMEVEYAEKLSNRISEPADRRAAIDAYGDAAITANTTNDIDELEKILNAQIKLKRHR